MKKEMKVQVIENLTAQIAQYPNFYLTDIEGLNAEKTSALRRECFGEGIKLEVVKNTLLGHVFKASGNEELASLVDILKGNTAVMFCETLPPSSSRSGRRIRKRSPCSRVLMCRNAHTSEPTSSTNLSPSRARTNSSPTSSPFSRARSSRWSPRSKALLRPSPVW